MSHIQETINEHKQRYVKGKKEDFIDAFLQEMFTQKERGDKNSVFSGTSPVAYFFNDVQRVMKQPHFFTIYYIKTSNILLRHIKP